MSNILRPRSTFLDKENYEQIYKNVNKCFTQALREGGKGGEADFFYNYSTIIFSLLNKLMNSSTISFRVVHENIRLLESMNIALKLFK